MVRQVELLILVDDSPNKNNPSLRAKHGLSVFVRAKTKGKDEVAVLMDTSPSSEILLHNADLMGVNLNKLDAVILSHAHYDHTGGLIGVLRSIKKRIPIIAHPRVFDVKLKVKPHIRYIGGPFSRLSVEEAGGILVLAKNSVTIAEGILTTGEIERSVEFEKVKGFWTVNNQMFKKDIMLDDQALVINMQDKGLVVLTGCAHSGIINTVKKAQKITGVNKIYAVIGGFHLVDAEETRIQATVKALKMFKPQLVGPCHCTGLKAKTLFSEVFGTRCQLLKTGDAVNL